MGGAFGSTDTATEAAIEPVKYECVIFDGNGTYTEPYLTCQSVTTNHGNGGSTAQFEMPELEWDEDVSALNDAEVIVYDTSGGFSAIVFQGFLSVNSDQLNNGTNKKTLSATSILGLLAKCNVGDNNNVSEVNYYAIDPKTKKPTTWTPRRILNDIFNNQMLSYWKQYVHLGATDLITDSRENMPDFSFKNASFAQALDQLLSIQGDVAYRERWNGVGVPHVYIDFYRVSNPNGAAITVQVGETSQGTVSITDITNSCDANDAVTRVKARGKVRNMITAANFDYTGSDETELVIKGWSNTSFTTTINGQSVTKTPEEFVLEDPERANPNSDFFIRQCEFVRKRWLLPTAVWGLTVAKENCLREKSTPDASGESSLADRQGASKEPFVFEEYVDIQHDATQPQYDAVGKVTDGVFTTATGAKFYFDQPTPYFMLEKPALRLVTKNTDENGRETRTYANRNFGVTFTVERGNITYDTGVTGDLRHPMLSQDGFIQTIDRTDCFYDCLTNMGQSPDGASLQLKDKDGTERVFWCFYPDQSTGTIQQIESATALRNDYKKLREIANNVAREKNRRNRSYQIRLPWVSLGFGVGTSVVPFGVANYVPDTYMITSVTHDYANNATSFQCCNVRPRAAQIV